MRNKMALDALTAALAAMEHMANVLNNIDAVDEDEDAQHDVAFEAVRAAIAALQAEPQTEHCVDVHALLREAADQKAARTEQLPTEQDCISMMVQCRLRLLELGWTSGEYAPKDGKEFEGINPGFAGPSTYTHLGSGFFIASPGDWWPAPRPLVFRLPATPPKD